MLLLAKKFFECYMICKVCTFGSQNWDSLPLKSCARPVLRQQEFIKGIIWPKKQTYYYPTYQIHIEIAMTR
ncbi:hypothetical protein OUZ56_031286 [Daphnia magna]|uniref:Uncharacterized protein n=1 Tax=Daphnia magna TaxID=35525 RepID=A0ABQ9ZTT5_9CRUS|nr:hypothetical protein OUZ56_031286 [Daphnia magna]